MPTPDRAPGESYEEGTIYSDESVFATQEGEQRYTSNRFSMYDGLGEFNPRFGGLSDTGQTAVAFAPTDTSGTSGASWSDIGSLFWDGVDLPGVPTDYDIRWEGWVEPGSATYEIRLVLASDGTVLGSVTITGGTGQQFTSLDVDETLIPTTHDAIVIQHRSAGGGSGGLTYAGQLVLDVV
jgi:hypothetical protein